MPTPQSRPQVRPGIVLLVLCLAQFMLVLDISVTNVALASIRADLGFAVADLQWIVTAYTLVLGSLLIFFGRVGDLSGRRRLFIAGTTVFSTASLFCGLAQTPGQLVAARAFQGLGGAMMSPAALSLLTSTFDEGAARNRALGVWGSIAAGGAAAGMIIGGVLTDLASWRWVFLINVPVGIGVILAARSFVPESRATRGSTLDVPGAVTLTAALAALVYGLTAAGPEGPSGAAAGAWLVAAAALLVAFVVSERRARDPLVDFSLLTRRGVSAANAFAVLSTAVVVGQSFFLSLYLREVLGFSPMRTGLALVPLTLVVVTVASSIPRVLPRAGVRAVLVSSGLFLAAGMALQARMPVDGRYAQDVLPALLVTAAGLGLGFVTATIAATTGVAKGQQGLASGLLNTSQQIGASLGLAVLATIAASRSADALADGSAPVQALTDGFSAGFAAAAALALVAVAVAVLAPGRGPASAGLPPQRSELPAAPGTTPSLAGTPALTKTTDGDTDG